jgi:carbamate kinase
MHDCGLYSVEDMRPINETRMAARWKLGKALAAVKRGNGPGRGQKMSGGQTSFRKLLTELDLDKDVAMKAQRIGAMPDEEMARAFEQARGEAKMLIARTEAAPDLPTNQ